MGTKEIANAFADLLSIRVINKMQCHQLLELGIGFTRFDYKPVSTETKEKFAKALEKFICQSIKERNSLTFAYEYGKVRPLGTLDENMTDDLSVVLQELPELAIAESYSFPCETIMKIVVTTRKDKLCETTFGFSNNILEKLKKYN